MSFPLGSLQADGSATATAVAAQAPVMGGRRQMLLTAGFVACALLLMCMASYHAGDPAFTTSGTGDPVRNWAGAAGAWVADLLLFLFGWSAWWLVPHSDQAFPRKQNRLIRGK